MEFVAAVHVVLASHATVGVDVTVVAAVDSDRVPVVNVVDVAVMFQPEPEPVPSLTSRPWLDVTTWSDPFNVAEKLTLLGADTNAREPPVSVAVAVEANAPVVGNTTSVTTIAAKNARVALLERIFPPLRPEKGSSDISCFGQNPSRPERKVGKTPCLGRNGADDLSAG
jgi:hypothetical protein